MEDAYVIDDAPIQTTQMYPTLSRISYGKIARYQARTAENLAMTTLDMHCNHMICAHALAAHLDITGMARKAAEMYPEAADRFRSIAVQNYCHLSQIIDESMMRR